MAKKPSKKPKPAGTRPKRTASRSGTRAGIGFMLGFTDDVTPKLKKLKTSYTKFMADLFKMNGKVQKQLTKVRSTATMAAGFSASASSRVSKATAGAPARKGRMSSDDMDPRHAIARTRRSRDIREKTVKRYSTYKTPNSDEDYLEYGKTTRELNTELAERFAHEISKGKFLKPSLITKKFVDNLDEELIPVLERMNKAELKALARKSGVSVFAAGKVADLLQKARMKSSRMAADFEMMERSVELMRKDLVIEWSKKGLEVGEQYLEKHGAMEIAREFTQKTGKTLDQSLKLFRDVQGGHGAYQSHRGTAESLMAMRDSGFRHFDNEEVTHLAGQLGWFKRAFGMEEKESSKLLYRLIEQNKISSDEALKFVAKVGLSSQITDVSIERLSEVAIELTDAMAGRTDFSSDEKLNLLSTVSAFEASLKQNFGEVDFGKMVRAAIEDPNTSALIAGSMGMSSTGLINSLKSEDGVRRFMEHVFEQIQPISSMNLGDAASRSAAINVAKSRLGTIGDSMSIEDIGKLATHRDEIMNTLSHVLEKQRTASSSPAAHVTSMNWLDDLAQFISHASNVTGVTRLGDFLDQVGAFKAASGMLSLGQGIFGLKLGIEGIVGGAGSAIGAGGKMLKWFGSLIGFAKKAAVITTVAAGVEAVAAATTVATAAAVPATVASTGFFASLGAGLTAMLPAIPVMLTIAAVMAAVGVAAAGIGYGVGQLAPTLTAVFGGLGKMDATQMLTAGPAMAAMGLGFSLMTTGLVAGMATLGAADVGNKVLGWLGITSGLTIGEGIAKLFTDLDPVVSVIGRLQAAGFGDKSALLIPMPVVAGDIDAAEAQLDRLKAIYGEYDSIMTARQNRSSSYTAQEIATVVSGRMQVDVDFSPLMPVLTGILGALQSGSSSAQRIGGGWGGG